MKENHEFVFSVVMAVYNAAPYLGEAFESLQRQSIGFDKVQVILADDGSTDGSGKLCDMLAKKHPENVSAIHQRNAGQSAARNAGLALAEGRYLNFMDSDDRLSPQTLERVAAFFAEHEAETDVVTVPMRYFEADEGEHWQNDLFEQGSRVINLKKDFAFLQASASNAFFVRERVRDIRFREGMSYAEDTRYAMTCLSRLQTIGLERDGCYEYRRRAAGDSSTQKKADHPQWKTGWMDGYELWAMDFFLKKEGHIPRWVQYALLCHLGNRVQEDAKAESTDGEAWYTEKIRKVAACIEPEVFAAAGEVQDGIRLMLKSLTVPGEAARLCRKDGGWKLEVGEETVCEISSLPVRLDRVQVLENRARLEGFAFLYPGMEKQALRLYLAERGQEKEIPLERRESRDIVWNGIPLYHAYEVCAETVPDSSGQAEVSFSFRLAQEEETIDGRIEAGDQVPVLPYPYSTGWSGGWKYIVSATAVHLFPCASLPARVKREMSWCLTLIRKRQYGALRKRARYHLMKLGGRTPRWAREARKMKMSQLSMETKYNADLLF